MTDYCATAKPGCVKHLALSMNDAMTESAFCAACGASCSGQSYGFETCEDLTVKVETQVSASASAGSQYLTYLYDGHSLDLTAVIESTTGGTYKPTASCLGGAPTVSEQSACYPYAAIFKCP